MEDLSWDGVVSFPWSSNEIEESFVPHKDKGIFDPIQLLQKPGYYYSNLLKFSNYAKFALSDSTTAASDFNFSRRKTEDGLPVFSSGSWDSLWSNLSALSSGVSSGDSLTKEPEESLSHCSSEKRKRTETDLVQSPDFGKKKKPRSESSRFSSNISFRQQGDGDSFGEPDSEALAQMKEMIYRAAAFRPVNFGAEEVEKPKRKNVRISSDPQTAAARQRREKISERIRVLQRLVPGGNKMDTASMLEEACSYLKFLRSQVKALEGLGQKLDMAGCSIPPSHHPFPLNQLSFPMQTQFALHNQPRLHPPTS